jgi:hypothetical protein
MQNSWFRQRMRPIFLSPGMHPCNLWSDSGLEAGKKTSTAPLSSTDWNDINKNDINKDKRQCG